MTASQQIAIGNRSKVIIGASPNHNSFGSSKGGLVLYLKFVQVIELVEYEAASAESYGLEPVQGGYSSVAESSVVPPEFQNDLQPIPDFVQERPDLDVILTYMDSEGGFLSK